MLPAGVNTLGQVLMCIVVQSDKANDHVGYLWYKPDPTKRTVFIYDFHIFNASQGSGLGKQSLRAFEEYLQERGLKRSDCVLQVIMLARGMFMKPADSGLQVSI